MSFIGPVLPHHLQETDVSKPDQEPVTIGPVLPSGWKKDSDSSKKEDQDVNNPIGPTLPPNFGEKRRQIDEGSDVEASSKKGKTEKSKKVIGPYLPPGFTQNRDDDSDSETDLAIGPTMPPSNFQANAGSSEDSSDDEHTIGPLPPSGNFIEVEEHRHQASKHSSELKGLQREEWIASLPEHSEVAKKLGFGKSVTSFSSKPVSLKPIVPIEQDSALNEAVEEYNKSKRPEALVDIHKKGTKQETTEERPRQLLDFNPEEAMKVQNLDSKHTKAIVDSAKFMSAKFSSPIGSNKFL